MLNFAPEPAHAQFYGPGAWCAVTNTGWGNTHWDCRYRSIGECRPNALAGNRGFCNKNPSFAPKHRIVDPAAIDIACRQSTASSRCPL